MSPGKQRFIKLFLLFFVGGFVAFGLHQMMDRHRPPPEREAASTADTTTPTSEEILALRRELENLRARVRALEVRVHELED